MPGGLLQLVAQGAADFYFTGNPSISFFKSVHKKHTNFASESIRIHPKKKDLNLSQSTILKFEIDRNADLLSDVYLSFELPSVLVANDPTCTTQFKWIENIGEMIIRDCYVTIGGNLIERFDGEFIHLHNQLNLSMDKRRTYNKMTANIPEYNNPSVLNQNKYPYSSNINNPSIRGRRVYVPLPFWFSKNKGVSLPLIALQYHDVEIHVELRPLNECYRVIDTRTDYESNSVQAFYAPDPNNSNHDLSNFLVNDNFVGSDIINIDTYLECNYVFLDDNERNFFSTRSLDYLIDQVQIREFDGQRGSRNLELILQNPIKELIWVTKRSDQNTFNLWNDYTDFSLWNDVGGDTDILEEAKILFNGLDRIETKPSEYFSLLQVFQHHTSSRDGIYVYSFALDPLKFQPSGAANASRINKFEVFVQLKSGSSTNYDFGVKFFAVNMNILTIMSGMGSVKWMV